MTNNASSDVVPHGIRVRAAAQYSEEESDPDRPLHVFVYRIQLTNEGDEPARLESRHWVIVDGHGNQHEVRGPGVVGEFPNLAPGESFDYSSRCPLTTSWGTMEGSYRFRRPDGEAFEVVVGRFFLAPSAPSIVQQLGS
ncbi:MAG: Co2+/Mg2+ efflux protein ApaG [Planctomycetota bacterium]